jgi:acyl-CoA dehydrogenase
MLLALTPEQQMLADMAAEFAAKRAPIDHTRALRNNHKAMGYDPALWQEMAALGLVGIPFPEHLGGSGLGVAEICIVMEAFGRTLAPEPFLSCVLMGGLAVHLGGSETQAGQLIPELCGGNLTLAFAHEEDRGYNLQQEIVSEARPDGDDYLLTGKKLRVFDASTASQIVVTARICGKAGATMFLVPANAEGVGITATGRVDSRNAATVTFNAVRVPKSAVIGFAGGADALIEAVLDRAITGLCAEMVGLMSGVFEATLEHLRTRVQFDVPIGSFQALQHRAAICFIELELARSIVMAAARLLDEGSPAASRMVSAAKTRCSDAAMLIAGEALQMHGGMGMTDECNVGLYLKRAKAASMTFGDASWHRARFAGLSGF